MPIAPDLGFHILTKCRMYEKCSEKKNLPHAVFSADNNELFFQRTIILKCLNIFLRGATVHNAMIIQPVVLYHILEYVLGVYVRFGEQRISLHVLWF